MPCTWLPNDLPLAWMFRLMTWIPRRYRVARVRMPNFTTPLDSALQLRSDPPIPGLCG